MSDYSRIIVLESGDDEMERVIKERAETSEREDDKEEISRTKLQGYNENTRPMIDSLADPSKAVKVYYCQDNKIARYSMRMLQTHAPAIFSIIVFILMRLRPFPFLSTLIRYVIDAYERDNLICMHFRFDPLSRAFSNRCVFNENAQRVSVDGRSKRIDI